MALNLDRLKYETKAERQTDQLPSAFPGNPHMHLCLSYYHVPGLYTSEEIRDSIKWPRILYHVYIWWHTNLAPGCYIAPYVSIKA